MSRGNIKISQVNIFEKRGWGRKIHNFWNTEDIQHGFYSLILPLNEHHQSHTASGPHQDVRSINLEAKPAESVVWTHLGVVTGKHLPVCYDRLWSEGLVFGVVIKPCLGHRSWTDLNLNLAAGAWANFSTSPSFSFLICETGCFHGLDQTAGRPGGALCHGLS